MTATLFKTSVKCAGGLFRFPYKHVRGLIPPQHENGYDYDQYDKLSNMLKNDYNDSILQAVADENQSFWPALNPVAFASHLGTGLSAATAADIAPLPTKITMLRRVKGDKLNTCGVDIELGAEIPPWSATHVELRADPIGQALYNGHHHKALIDHKSALSVVLDDDDDSGRPSQARRILMNAVQNPLNAVMLLPSRARRKREHLIRPTERRHLNNRMLLDLKISPKKRTNQSQI